MSLKAFQERRSFLELMKEAYDASSISRLSNYCISSPICRMLSNFDLEDIRTLWLPLVWSLMKDNWSHWTSKMVIHYNKSQSSSQATGLTGWLLLFVIRNASTVTVLECLPQRSSPLQGIPKSHFRLWFRIPKYQGGDVWFCRRTFIYLQTIPIRTYMMLVAYI
jgi:hypothetical protein